LTVIKQSGINFYILGGFVFTHVDLFFFLTVIKQSGINFYIGGFVFTHLSLSFLITLFSLSGDGKPKGEEERKGEGNSSPTSNNSGSSDSLTVESPKACGCNSGCRISA
jgi:hypothetical protein